MDQQKQPVTTSQTYHPTSYKFPAPSVLPPVTDPMPMEKLREKDLQAKKNLQEKDKKYKEKIEAQQQKGSLFGKIASHAMEVVKVVDTGATSTINAVKTEYYEKSDETSVARYRNLHYPVQEVLGSDFHCKIHNNSNFAVGYLFISTSLLSFDGYVDALYTQNQQPMRVTLSLPLSNIVCLRKAVSLKALEKGKPTDIKLVEKPEDYSDALIVYANDGMTHQFWGFSHYQINYFEDMWNVLDHYWRQNLNNKQHF